MDSACIAIPQGSKVPKVHNLGKTDKTPRRGINNSIQDALFNDIDPRCEVKREKPAHRQIIDFAELGFNNKEIGRAMDMTPAHVSTILKQPWARERIVKDLKKSTQDEVKAMIETMAADSLTRIEALAIEARSETVKLSANQYFVDRFLGKPTQPISTDTANLGALSDKELERIAIGGNARTTGGFSSSPATEDKEQPGGLG
jgi:hypothetical protein